MSTVQVSNITDGTNSVETVYVARGSAKAWVNFNGTGTIAARDSLNLSSLTDNGTGDYTLNWTNAFSAATYAVTGQTSSASGSIALGGLANYRDSSNVITVPAAAGWRSRWADGPGNFFDPDIAITTAFGDLA